MHSMTGYGRGQAMSQGTKVIAEIQSVNKRQIEILVNLPSALASLESDLRAKVDRSLHRGRIIVTISASGPAAPHQPVVDSGFGEPLPGTIQTLQKELALPGEITIETILRSPGVISASEQGVLDSATRSAVDAALDLALEQLLQMRAKEGSNLHKELLRRQIHRPCSLKNSQASATRREAVSRWIVSRPLTVSGLICAQTASSSLIDVPG
jgi:uncharacterized protein (TIGR00255 family)